MAKTSKTMNKENKEPIFEFDLSFIASFFRSIDRQGPGGDEQTLRALEFLPETGPDLRIADIGCGTGHQTEVLARHLGGTITAVDLLPEMIEGLEARMQRAGLNDRVTGLVGSMDDLPFRDGEFDLIWAEGSIYNIGFGRGLAEWRRFLKPGGVIAVTECSWLSGARLPESKFIRENFPDIDTPSAKVRILEEAGYAPLAHFALPPHCWTENYFTPLVKAREIFSRKYDGNKTVEELISFQHHEAELYRKYKEFYGYVFYIAKKMK